MYSASGDVTASPLYTLLDELRGAPAAASADFDGLTEAHNLYKKDVTGIRR